MKKLFVSCVFVFLCSTGSAFAQTQVPSPTPATTKLQWNHDGINLSGFKLFVDNVGAEIGLATLIAANTYQHPFPALTPGNHLIEVSAFNIAGDSGRASLSVRVVVVPTSPTNLQIIVVRDMVVIELPLRLRS